MTTIILWLKAATVIQGFAIPHWVFLFFTVGAVLEYFLGRSKNPRLRSLAGYVMSALSLVLTKTHITDIPKVGDVVKKVLNFIAPPPTTNCKCCNGTGIQSGTVE